MGLLLTTKFQTPSLGHSFKRLVPIKAIFLAFVWALRLFLQKRKYLECLSMAYVIIQEWHQYTFSIVIAALFHRALCELAVSTISRVPRKLNNERTCTIDSQLHSGFPLTFAEVLSVFKAKFEGSLFQKHSLILWSDTIFSFSVFPWPT